MTFTSNQSVEGSWVVLWPGLFGDMSSVIDLVEVLENVTILLMKISKFFATILSTVKIL